MNGDAKKFFQSGPALAKAGPGWEALYPDINSNCFLRTAK